MMAHLPYRFPTATEAGTSRMRGMPPGGIMNNGVTDARPELAELATLADALVSEIAEARGRYEELAAVIDGADVEVDGVTPHNTSSLVDEAHLVALAMATTGSTPEETREQLRTELGIDEPDEIVDEAFAVKIDSQV